MFISTTFSSFFKVQETVNISSDILSPTLNDASSTAIVDMSTDATSTSTLMKRLEVLSSPSRFVVLEMSKERQKRNVAATEDEIAVIHDGSVQGTLAEGKGSLREY
jgi:hypothetical protein